MLKKYDYKELAEKLCLAFQDLPSGCDGCPLSEDSRIDSEGDAICPLYDLERLK